MRGGDEVAAEAAWGYDTPSAAFAPIAGYVAFYAARMDACFVDDELVVAATRRLLRRLDHVERGRPVQGRPRLPQAGSPPTHAQPASTATRIDHSELTPGRAGYLTSRDMRRSARTLPPVWHCGQYVTSWLS